jgi:glycerol-3-phosphate acyltransferase PlsY
LLELGFKALVAYLLGSVIGSLLLGQLKGVDIRTQGSGNAGGTNALRTQGWAFALGVILIDVGKALIAVGWLPDANLPVLGRDPQVGRDWLRVACATAVVLGHVYPVWFQFRGGKGAATLIGAVGVLAPMALLPVVGAWLATVMLTGFVGLGTMLATATLPVYFALAEPARPALVAYGLAMAAFIVYTHRSNLQRMRAGNENRARRLWLLRPRG